MQPELQDLKKSMAFDHYQREKNLEVGVGVRVDLGFSKEKAEYFSF